MIRDASSLIAAVASVGLIGWLDCVTDPYLSLTLLYLAPIGFATWHSTWAGLATAGAAGIVSLAGNLHSPSPQPDALVPYWNCLLHSGVFAALVFMVSTLRHHTAFLHALVNKRTRKLKVAIEERKRIETEAGDALHTQKQNIANQLHDGLAQALTAIALHTKHLEEELEASFSPHASFARRIATLLDDAVNQSRKIARGLNTMELDATELVAALTNLAADTCQTHRMICALRNNTAAVVVSAEAGLHIYLIVQQAIDNAIRHGAARHIEIELEQDDYRLRVRIKDNGCGFNATPGTASGLGLRLMRFRAGLLKAGLTINSKTGRGTQIELIAERAVIASSGSHQVPRFA